MSEVVLDSSAIIAVLKNEAGADQVRPVLRGGRASTLVVAEIASWMTSHGTAPDAVVEIVRALELLPEIFNEPRALATGLLVTRTRHRGLSLADRACLALGIELGLPVITADRAWAGLDLGIEIRLIR